MIETWEELLHGEFSREEGRAVRGPCPRFQDAAEMRAMLSFLASSTGTVFRIRHELTMGAMEFMEQIMT